MKLNDDTIDFLQTISAIWNIESGKHPTIKVYDPKYIDFKARAREKYHDKIDSIIKKGRFNVTKEI
jgi:hypothetical protein